METFSKKTKLQPSMTKETDAPSTQVDKTHPLIKLSYKSSAYSAAGASV